GSAAKRGGEGFFQDSTALSQQGAKSRDKWRRNSLIKTSYLSSAIVQRSLEVASRNGTRAIHPFQFLPFQKFRRRWYLQAGRCAGISHHLLHRLLHSRKF